MLFESIIRRLTSKTSSLVEASGSSSASRCLPHFFRGKVVRGYGRGGHKLGCPTANLDEDAISSLPGGFPSGVYAGFARIGGGELHKMVMSVGRNVQFGNQHRTMEVHIMHDIRNDFYDETLEGVILAYIRPMKSFETLDDLIRAIEEDKEHADRVLSESHRES
ncbi:riboflavin kinase-like protein, partial [Aphelenchoides avenae]